MDPRNSLNSSDIFQFEELSNPGCDRNTLNLMTNWTFLAGHEQEIVNVANNKNINAYYIVARLIQEQGRDGSVLVKGEGYNGQYIGYYNAFNVAASGNTNEEIIMNGLAYASKKGWDTLEKSIEGGINLLANNYIAKVWCWSNRRTILPSIYAKLNSSKKWRFNVKRCIYKNRFNSIFTYIYNTSIWKYAKRILQNAKFKWN